MVQSVTQPISCHYQYIIFTLEKSSLKMCATFVIFRTLPKVNNSPMGENSYNLVTLFPRKKWGEDFSVFLQLMDF
jgi:hypothetical protein